MITSTHACFRLCVGAIDAIAAFHSLYWSLQGNCTGPPQETDLFATPLPAWQHKQCLLNVSPYFVVVAQRKRSLLLADLILRVSSAANHSAGPAGDPGLNSAAAPPILTAGAPSPTPAVLDVRTTDLQLVNVVIATAGRAVRALTASRNSVYCNGNVPHSLPAASMPQGCLDSTVCGALPMR
jgi:hypothetical protein